jgi:hypothetical protein
MVVPFDKQETGGEMNRMLSYPHSKKKEYGAISTIKIHVVLFPFPVDDIFLSFYTIVVNISKFQVDVELFL